MKGQERIGEREVVDERCTHVVKVRHDLGVNVVRCTRPCLSHALHHTLAVQHRVLAHEWWLCS